jgi:aerobic-type carbon monoxide dehydrogenase small subunit (CoxS/CutS family)
VSTTIRLTINGTETTVEAEAGRRLLDVLREDLGLTGTKYGCGEGQCGSCLVHLDGEPTRSCLLPASDAAGRSVTTIEGLAPADSLHAVQQAFLDEGAMQCGYCTSGMILAAVALLERTPDPTPEQIVSGMDGHLCRCNGYVKIVNAVRKAAKTMRAAAHG